MKKASRLSSAVFLLLLAGAVSALAQETSDAVPAPVEFRHPGLLNDLDELRFIKQKIEAGEEPWKTAFEKMRDSKCGKLDYAPHPHEVTTSGIGGAGSKEGGTSDEGNDSHAAYAQALLWVLTGNEQYARNAAAILNAWSILQTHGGGNWYLAASWSGSTFPEAAELLRATYPQWGAEDIARFSAMLSRAFLPLLHDRLAYGNRELSTCNALVAIGVFNNDPAAFAEGIAHWKDYVPAYIYLAADGPRPRKASYWLKPPAQADLDKLDAKLFPDPSLSWMHTGVADYIKENHLGDDRTMMTKIQESDFDKVWYNPGVYLDGMCAETCRDLGHVELALAGMVNTAEIAWHQGIDLYTPQSDRITAFLEFHAALRLGGPVPPELHGGQLDANNVFPTYEIAYNHYHNRKGLSLPKTRELIDTVIRQMQAEGAIPVRPPVFARKIGSQTGLHASWETLTHGELSTMAK